MNVLALMSIFLLTLNAGNSCLTSSEDYATEVVVPNYNLDDLHSVAIRTSDYFLKESAYSKDLLSIIQTTENPSGLSIRLQIPTEVKEITKPRIKILSDSASGNLRDNLQGTINGWTTQCNSNSCSFEKDLITITAEKDSKQASIEINKALDKCDAQCTGVCFDATTESKCIDIGTKVDIDILLKYTSISSGLRELLNSYKIAGSQDIVLQDIVPSTSNNVNFQEAMKQELVYLSAKGIVTLAKEDIDSISLLAKQGRAGNNYRIVYNTKTKQWTYYNNLENAILSAEKTCETYEKPLESPGIVQSIKTPFYLVPIIITLVSVIALLVLTIIARTITSKKPIEKV